MAKKGTTKLTNQGSYWAFNEVPDIQPDNSSNDMPNSSASEPLVHHPIFLFDNVLVAIQIENTLFNVHKYQLAKSKVFSDMFKMPKPQGDKPEEGSSLEHPVVIRGVAAPDFAALLTVLYASLFSSNQPAPKADLVIPAFRLANMFDFSELREYLLPLAEEELDDVDKIVFAREFDIKEWLAPAHVRLCQREKPLNDEEARKLGVGSVLIIWRMREQHRSRSSGSAFTTGNDYCNVCSGMSYTGGGNFCTRGDGRIAYLRCNDPSKTGGGGATATDNTAIEKGVKEWVENGCTIRD